MWEEELQVAIYRIAQKHLTNVLKHSQASEVWLRLDSTPHLLSLVIHDNGIGFDTTKRQGGIGITNMKSRASLINGEIKMESEEGHGCTMSLIIPMTN